MANYKEIIGTAVRNNAGNLPSTQTEELFFDTTNIDFKYQFAAVTAAWRTGNNVNTGRRDLGGTGIQTAALIWGGYTPGPSVKNETESYNGTTWTEVNNLGTARNGIWGAGPYTSAIFAGGDENAAGSASAKSEEWNGTSWAETADLNTARYSLGGSGTNAEAALCFGGTQSPKAQTENWNGTSWSEVADLNTGRSSVTGFGTETSALATSGDGSTPRGLVETWNGTSWTETTDLNTGRANLASCGTLPSGMVFGGPVPGGGKTELWNGSAWTETTDFSTARELTNNGAGASSQSGLASAGFITAPSAATEEWNAVTPVGAWTTSGNLNTARLDGGTAGTQTAGLIFAGGPTVVANTETYNGSTFSEVNDVNTGRALAGSFGTQTAAIMASGYGTVPNPGLPENTNLTEQWNGTCWTEITDINRSVRQLAGAGTTTSGLVFGGDPGPGAYVESWNGSAWTEVADLNQARTSEPLGVGASNTSAICAAGYSISPDNAQFTGTELWNGTSWTEVNNVNTGRHLFAGSGTQTACIGFGGFPVPAAGAKVEDWNGINWVETSDLNTARGTGGTVKGTSTEAAAMGGAPTPSGSTAATENWSGTSNTIKVLTD